MLWSGRTSSRTYVPRTVIFRDICFPVSRIQVTGGLSKPGVTTAHARQPAVSKMQAAFCKMAEIRQPEPVTPDSIFMAAYLRSACLLHISWQLEPTVFNALAVPNLTAHPSTSSVPTSSYSMWDYNCLCTITG